MRDGAVPAPHEEGLPGPAILHQFPWTKIPSNDAVPPEVAAAAHEANLCFAAGAWNACGVMARRAIQALAIEKGAPSGDKLHVQLDNLRDRAVLTPAMHEWATELRLDGNTGAHPKPRSLDQADCSALVEFLREILDHVYVHPARLAEKRRARTPSQPANGETG